MGEEDAEGPEEMRVFLDASIWLSALRRPTGGSGVLCEMTGDGRLVAISSVVVLEEVGRNLEKIGITPAKFEALVLRVRPFLVAIRPDDLNPWAAVVEKDRHVIAGAVLGKADFLVTFDKAHLDNPKIRGLCPVPIGDAGACLAWLREKGNSML